MNTPWLQVLGSRRFDLANPRAEDVDFRTVATVLARTARFTGHTERGVYSVAQHCREGAYAILRDTGRRDVAAVFLLHDGHEYIVGDIATPVRDAICYHAILESGDLGAGDVVRNAIKALKRRCDVAIFTAAGIPLPVAPDVTALVKAYDIRMLRTERDARLAPPPEPWEAVYEAAVPVAGVDTSPWTESHARNAYIVACYNLFPQECAPTALPATLPRVGSFDNC